jgi:glycosyltransferase involved in cell wall biosynthesis
MDEKNIITFILPTLGRNTLLNSLSSLYNLNNKNWNAIIIFDGIKNNFEINDKRIKIIEIEKSGKEDIKNSAGLVRNIGFSYVDTEWIGFLDDDDYLSPNYIDYLINEITYFPKIDACIFRMGYENGTILPSKLDKNIIRNKVGISFAIKKYITQQVTFINSPFEDYIFLKNIIKLKYKTLLSSYVAYFVRTYPYKCDIFPKLVLS